MISFDLFFQKDIIFVTGLKFIYNQCKLRKTHGTFSTQNFKHKWDDFVTVLHDNHKKKKNNLPSWFFLRGFLYCDFVLTNEEIGKTDFQIKNQLHIVKDIKKFLKACVFNLPVSLDCVLPPHRVGYLLKLFNKITNRLINHVQDHPILLKISSCSSLQKNFSSLLKELCDLLNLLCTIWVTHVSKILTWWSLRCAMNCVNDDIYSLDVLYLLGLCRYISQLNSPMVTSDVRKSFIFLYETILAMQLATLKNLVQSPIYNQTPYNNEKSNAIKTNFLFEESFQNFLKQLENNTEFPFQTSFVLRKPAQRIRKFTFYDLVGSLHQRVRLSEPNLFLYNNENKTVIFQQIGFLHCLPYFFSCFYFQSQELRSLKKSNSDTLYAVLIFLVNLQYPLLETTQQDMFPLMESLVTLNRLLQLYE
jgi:hypothetical protein